MTEESGPTEEKQEKKSSTDNLWDTILKTVQNLTQQATRYTSLVQKKVELFILNRKVSAAHNALGKVIDESRGADDADSFEKPEVKAALLCSDTLRQNIAKLSTEIETLTKESQKPAAEPTEPPGT